MSSVSLLERAKKVIVPLHHSVQQFEEPVLLVVMGVPGSGKSYVARKIAAKFPLHYAAADNVRLALCPNPNFCATENKETYTVLYAAVKNLLQQGQSVLMEGTVLRREYRTEIRELFAASAQLVLIFIDPPRVITKARLLRRKENFRDPLAITFAGSTELLERLEKELERPIASEAPHFFHLKNKDAPTLHKELQPVYQLLRSHLTEQ